MTEISTELSKRLSVAADKMFISRRHSQGIPDERIAQPGDLSANTEQAGFFAQAPRDRAK